MKKHICFRGVFLLFTISLLLACDNSNLSQAEIEQIIAKSTPLTKVDRFCTNLPKPSGMKFIYKQLGGNSFTVHIDYRYKTTLSFSEMRDYYQKYFDENRWQRETLWDENESFYKGYIRFRNGKQFVSIEHVNFINANFAIGCGEEN